MAGFSGTRSTRSVTRPDPDGFDGDKEKLDLLVTQLCVKLLHNADHYERAGQNTEQRRRLVSRARQNTLGGLFKQLPELDSRLKVFSKQHLVRTDNTNSTIPTPRPALGLAMPAAFPVPVVSNAQAPAPFSGSATHAGPTNPSTLIRRELFGQAERDRRSTPRPTPLCANAIVPMIETATKEAELDNILASMR